MMRSLKIFQLGAGRRKGVLFRFGSYHSLASSAPIGRAVLMLLLCFVVASCSEFEVRPDTEHKIQLSVYSDVATKGSSGGPIIGEEFPDNRLILLSAYYIDPRGEHNQNLFTDITFSKYGTPSVWQAGTAVSPNVKYWPFWGTMDFIAVTKANSVNSTSLAGVVSHPQNSNVAAAVRYDMPDNSSLQDDVMFAFAGGRDCDAHLNVPMIFRHAQALVSVKASTNINSSSVGVSVRGVYLCDAKYSGLVEALPAGSDDVTISWIDVATPVPEVPIWISSGVSQRLTLQAESVGRGVLVPAQSPAGSVSIRLDLTIHNGYKADGVTYDNVDVSYIYTIPSGTWLAGKNYQYSFLVGLTEITCVMTVSDSWSDPVELPGVAI